MCVCVCLCVCVCVFDAYFSIQDNIKLSYIVFLYRQYAIYLTAQIVTQRHFCVG